MPNDLTPVEVLRPIKIGGIDLYGATIAVPRLLAQTLISHGVGKPTDGVPTDHYLENARSYIDLMTGEEFLAGALRSERPLDMGSEAKTRLEFLSQQVGSMSAKVESLVSARISEYLLAHEAEIKSKNDLLDAQFGALEKKSEELSIALSQTEDGRRRLAERVSSSAGDVLAEKYGERAQSKVIETRTWQLITILSIIGWGAFVITRIYALGEGSDVTAMERLFSLAVNLDWPGAAMLAMQSAPFVACASFGAVQVSRHQSAEQTFRKLSLELNLIDQYVGSLPLSEQHEIKRKFADRFFLGGTDGLSHHDQ